MRALCPPLAGVASRRHPPGVERSEDVKEIALAGVARAVVVGLGLSVIKVGVGGLLLDAPTARSLAEATVFEVLLGVFVGGPSGALERWLSLRARRAAFEVDERLEAPTLGLLTLLVAWVGAAAAYLQGVYAESALRTGSTDAGLDALLKNGRSLLEPLNAGGLCGAVALTFAACAVGRRWAKDDLRQQVLITLAGPIAAAVLLAVVSGGHQAALFTLLMSGFVGLLLPPMCRAADRLEAALGASLSARE